MAQNPVHQPRRTLSINRSTSAARRKKAIPELSGTKTKLSCHLLLLIFCDCECSKRRPICHLSCWLDYRENRWKWKQRLFRLLCVNHKKQWKPKWDELLQSFQWDVNDSQMSTNYWPMISGIDEKKNRLEMSYFELLLVGFMGNNWQRK